MNITININQTTPKVNIIKDEKADLEQISLVLDAVIKKVMNDPDQGEKAKMIGEEKLREMALKIYQEKIQASEQEQINNALEFAENFSQAMIKGLVKGAVEIAKGL
jgi:hypothetical protein